MELSMMIDISVQDAEGNYTEDCKMAEKEFKQRVKNVLETECVYYTFLDTMKTIEEIKKSIELKYEVLIVRNLKKYRFKN